MSSTTTKTTKSPAQGKVDYDPIIKELPEQQLIQWLRDMLLIREFEVRTMQSYQNKKIGGFCHVYIGQEAVAVGSFAALKPEDPVITAYRCHGQALARGIEPKYCMAEMYGKIGGCAKGKGGSMHLFDKSNNFFGGHGIVGAQVPVGAGLAFASKYIDEVINEGASTRVAMAFLGDGALNQGAFHEAMNLAGVLDLPLVVVCENNGYAMGTAIDRGTTRGDNISAKADGYGMEGFVVDGMDVLRVYADMKKIVDAARAECRPKFVDMRTYRYKGHSMSDPRKYRTKEEEQQYESQDPLDRLMMYLKATTSFSDEQYKTMNKDVRAEVKAAIKWAEQSPEPTPDEQLYHDVFVEEFGPYTGTSVPEMLEEWEKPDSQKS